MTQIQADIHADEGSDFYEEILKIGHTHSDFMLSAFGEAPAHAGATGRMVNVKRTVAGRVISRDYAAGHASEWVHSAVADVRNGVFGSP